MSLIKRMANSQSMSDTEAQSANQSAEASGSGLFSNSPPTEIVLGSPGTSPLPRNTVLQGRYDIEQVLGIGGMSTVYRARDLRFTTVARYCAVKEMLDNAPDLRTGQLRLANFEREASLLATLSHPGIPKIYDFFCIDNRVYLVLEYIEGRDLETQLEQRGGPMMEEDVISWAVQICDVLEYLHGQKPQPIIFRDLKPSNIIVNAKGKMTVVDFGIAKVFQSDKRGTMIGTEGYAPPEQYRGLAELRGDIYALGATMHHLLTNSDPRVQTPFTFAERPIRRFNPRVSEQTEQTILKAVEYDIDRRWPSAPSFRQALLQSKTGDAKIRIMSSSLDATALEMAASPALNLLSSITEDTSALPYDSSSKMPSGMLGMPLTAPVIHGPQIRAPKPVEIGEGGAQVLWTFTSDDEIRSSPLVMGGVVFFGSYDTNLYALNAKSGDFVWKASTKAGICSSPVLAEDLIVVGSEDNYVYGFDARRGTLSWSFRTGMAVRSSPHLYKDLVVVGSDDQHAYCLQAQTGELAWKYRTWNFVRSSAAFAQGLAFIGSSDGNLYALDLLDGTLKWKLHTLGAIVSTPLVAGSNVIIGSMDNYVYAADITTGFTSWRFECQHSVSSSATVLGGRVMIGSADGHMYALDAPTGRLIWSFDSGSQITSSPRVSLVNDSVYFGAANNFVYCLDASSGELRWRYRTRGPVVSSPAVDDGIVYVGSLDRKLYALAS